MSSFRFNDRVVYSAFNLLEERPGFPHQLHNAGFLERTNKAQRLGFRPFKPVVIIRNPGVQLRRAPRKVCVVDRLQLGVFERVSVSVAKSALIPEQLIVAG